MCSLFPTQPYSADSQIYFPHGTEVEFPCEVDGVSTVLGSEEWQALGLDLGTVVQTTPPSETVTQWDRDMRQP